MMRRSFSALAHRPVIGRQFCQPVSCIGGSSLIQEKSYSATPAHDEDAGKRFLQQVDKFFDKAAGVLEDKLVTNMKGRISEDEKHKKVKGLLKQIKSGNNVIEMSFPIKRDSGELELISAWRSQHSHHRTPCKGGMNYIRVPIFNELKRNRQHNAHV